MCIEDKTASANDIFFLLMNGLSNIGTGTDNKVGDYDADNDDDNDDDNNDDDYDDRGANLYLANDIIFAAAEDCGFSNRSQRA